MWDSESVGPENAMWATIIVGLVSTGIFGLFVKDPKFQRREMKELERQQG